MSYEDQPMDQEEVEGLDAARSRAAERVKLPAIFLIIVGVLNFLGSCLIVLNGTIGILNPEAANQQANQFNPNQSKDLKQAGIDPVEFMKKIGVGYIIVGVLGLLAAIITIFGAVRMLSLKSYGLAVFGSILAAIPCISVTGCCGLGEGVGIWSLIVLMNADVKSAFR